jgi:hypothetical protein
MAIAAVPTIVACWVGRSVAEAATDVPAVRTTNSSRTLNLPVKANQAFPAGVYGVVIPPRHAQDGLISVLLAKGQVLQYSKVTQPSVKPFDVITPDMILAVAGDEGTMHLQVVDAKGQLVEPTAAILAAMQQPDDPNLLARLRDDLLERYGMIGADDNTPATETGATIPPASALDTANPASADSGFGPADALLGASPFDGPGDMFPESSIVDPAENGAPPLDGDSPGAAGGAGPSAPGGGSGPVSSPSSGGGSGPGSSAGSGGGSGMAPATGLGNLSPLAGQALYFTSPLNSSLIQPPPFHSNHAFTGGRSTMPRNSHGTVTPPQHRIGQSHPPTVHPNRAPTANISPSHPALGRPGNLQKPGSRSGPSHPTAGPGNVAHPRPVHSSPTAHSAPHSNYRPNTASYHRATNNRPTGSYHPSTAHRHSSSVRMPSMRHR